MKSCPVSKALKGRDSIAQGSALGRSRYFLQALQERDNCYALTGLGIDFAIDPTRCVGLSNRALSGLQSRLPIFMRLPLAFIRKALLMT